MGECFIRGLLLEKGRFIYVLMRKNWMKFSYTGEIHGFAKTYKVEYIAPLGLLLDHAVFCKIEIIKILFIYALKYPMTD